jgi:hypothetical protein
MPSTLRSQPDIAALRRAWTNPGAFATTLFALYCDQFVVGMNPQDDDEDALRFHPETIQHEIMDLLGVPLPVGNFDRLMAAISLVTGDRFYTDVPTFIATCNVLSGSPFEPDTFDPANAEECAWGITEALLLAPPSEDDPEPFSEDVITYIEHVLSDEGIIRPPDVLRIGLSAHQQRLALKVDETFGDDPVAVSSIWAQQKERSDAITERIRSSLVQLNEQLSQLRLTHGRTADVFQRVFKESQ